MEGATAGSGGDKDKDSIRLLKGRPFRNWEKNIVAPSLPRVIPKELIPSNAVDITHNQNGKLWKVELDPGVTSSGVAFIPRKGALAKIHYKCWLLTDPEKKIFDSSSLMEGDTEPVELNLGTRQVIRAIDEGVSTMRRKGEKALFIAHYDFAYGKTSSRFVDSTNIPDGSFICAEVELVDMEGVKARANATWNMEVLEVGGDVNDDDKGGAFYMPLTTSSLMFIKLEGWKEGEGGDEDKKIVFLPEVVLPFTPAFNSWGFYATSSTQYPIPRAMGPLLRSLRKGDKMLFTFRGESAFEEGYELTNGVQSIKAGEEVKFVVGVEEVEEILDPFMLSLREKVEYCEKLLLRAMLYYNQSFYEAAACKFIRVVEYLRDGKRFLKVVPDNLALQCDEQLYVALCQLGCLYRRMPEMEAKEALQYLNEAVQLIEGEDQSQVKGRDFQMCCNTDAYSFRGKLYIILKDFELAKKDFDKAAELTQMEISGAVELEDDLAEKLCKLKIHFEGLATEVDKLDKEQRKSYLFKYVPPK